MNNLTCHYKFPLIFQIYHMVIVKSLILLLIPSCDDFFQANANSNNLEKKQRAFDKTIAEWQAKCNDLQSELENAQKEARGYSAELFRVKAQLEEANDTAEALRRENKNLAGECIIVVVIVIGQHRFVEALVESFALDGCPKHTHTHNLPILIFCLLGSSPAMQMPGRCPGLPICCLPAFCRTHNTDHHHHHHVLDPLQHVIFIILISCYRSFHNLYTQFTSNIF